MDSICDPLMQTRYKFLEPRVDGFPRRISVLPGSVPNYVTNAINNLTAHAECLSMKKSVLARKNLSNIMASMERHKPLNVLLIDLAKTEIANLLVLNPEIWLPMITIFEWKYQSHELIDISHLFSPSGYPRRHARSRYQASGLCQDYCRELD